MGYSLSWTAVRGKAPEAVLAAHALRPTGRTYDLPDRRTPFGWARLDGGWVLVASSPAGALQAAMAAARKTLPDMGSWHDLRFVDESDAADPFLAALSTGCELACCYVEEHVMVSRATAWKDGVRQWSILHDAQRGGVHHLVVVGVPPAALAALEATARAEQESVSGRGDHLFEVPVELAKAITGFRHDEAELELEVLEPAAAPRPKAGPRASFLARLFGRGSRLGE